MDQSILSRRDRLPLENGMSLRLLSALEVLQARREAREGAQSPEELPLWANGCLLARALEQEEGSPLFSCGREVLAGLTPGEIAALAGRWSRFNREENPGLALEEEELEEVKKNSALTPETGCAGGC